MSQGHFPFAIDRLVKKDRAIALTQRFWADMTKVWVLAWKEWAKVGVDQRLILSETPYVPAINVWSFAQHFARDLFSDRQKEGIVVCDALPMVFAFYIENLVLVRFNTFDGDFVVRNDGASERREQYFKHGDIPGLNNRATRLTVGQLANPTRTDVDIVAISCQIDEYCHFSFRVDGGDESVMPIPAPAGAPVPGPLHTETIKTAKPR